MTRVNLLLALHAERPTLTRRQNAPRRAARGIDLAQRLAYRRVPQACEAGPQ